MGVSIKRKTETEIVDVERDGKSVTVRVTNGDLSAVQTLSVAEAKRLRKALKQAIDAAEADANPFESGPRTF